MLVCAHAATSGAEIFSSFCTIHDTLHDIQHVIVVVGAYAMSVTRVQSATDWTASVHISHMSKPVM